MQSVAITPDVVSSDLYQNEVYNIIFLMKQESCNLIG